MIDVRADRHGNERELITAPRSIGFRSSRVKGSNAIAEVDCSAGQRGVAGAWIVGKTRPRRRDLTGLPLRRAAAAVVEFDDDVARRESAVDGTGYAGVVGDRVADGAVRIVDQLQPADGDIGRPRRNNLTADLKRVRVVSCVRIGEGNRT